METNTGNTYEGELILVLDYFRAAAEELKRKNRFSNEKLDKIVGVLVYADMNAETLRKNTILYRARKYTEVGAAQRFLFATKELYQGYDRDGSFANMEASSEGRCNPQYIPYLYASASIPCCVSEVSPRIGDYISVAQIRINKPIKILSLNKGFAVTHGEPKIILGIVDSTIILYLEMLFSRRHEKDGDYLLTQYLSEKIKNAGYDGISFASSVYAGVENTNFTIFNFGDCEAVSSKLCRISDIAIEFTFDSEDNTASQDKAFSQET